MVESRVVARMLKRNCEVKKPFSFQGKVAKGKDKRKLCE